MVIFYTKCKKYNEIELTKNKRNLNNRKSPILPRVRVNCQQYSRNWLDQIRNIDIKINVLCKLL